MTPKGPEDMPLPPPPPEGKSEAEQLPVPDDLPDCFTSDKQYRKLLADELKYREKQKVDREENPPDPYEMDFRTKESERSKLIEKRSEMIRGQYRSDPAEAKRRIKAYKDRMSYIALAATSYLDQQQAKDMLNDRKESNKPPVPPLEKPHK
jgi:hypothetical protein